MRPPAVRGLPLALLLLSTGCGATPSQERSTIKNSGKSAGENAGQPAATGDAAAILKRIGLTLPPTAQVEHAEQVSGMDDAARLALVMSQADWERLRARLVAISVREPAFSEDDNFLLGAEHEGWKPGEAPGLKTGQFLLANGTQGLNVGVAPAAAGSVRLFLFWHQT